MNSYLLIINTIIQKYYWECESTIVLVKDASWTPVCLPLFLSVSVSLQLRLYMKIRFVRLKFWSTVRFATNIGFKEKVDTSLFQGRSEFWLSHKIFNRGKVINFWCPKFPGLQYSERISGWEFYEIFYHLNLSWRGPLSYRNQSIDLICRTNQWTGFYMITASVMKELR